MVGGVFSQCLTAPGNPTAKNTENDTRDGEDNKDEKNRLGFVKINELTHPSNHRCEELTDQGKQRCENRGSALKSSSFHKNIYGNLSRTEQKDQHRKNTSENNEITNLGNREDSETILKRKNFH